MLNPDGTGPAWATYMGSGSATAVAFDPGGVIYVAGSNASFAPASISNGPSAAVTLVKISPETSPLQFSQGSITNAASFASGLPSPGGLATIFVSGLDLPASVYASSIPLPYELAGVSVFVGNVSAPLLSVTTTESGGQQINFQVPFGAGSNSLEVRYKGFSTFAWPVISAAGIFTLPDGTGVVAHASDYSLVTADNPAVPGEDIVVWGTGFGTLKTPQSSGVPAPGADPIAIGTNSLAFYTPAGRITYAGLAPETIGVYQANVTLRSDLPSGNFKFGFYGISGGPVILGPGIASNQVTIPIQ